MIDSMSFILPLLVFCAAILKRSEMALWLALITIFALVVSVSGAPVDSLVIFFSGANLILMLAAFASWRINKNILPFLIGVLSAFDVVANFSNLIILLNTGSLSYNAAIVSGVIGYAQLVLVCTLEDSRGVLNELVDDVRSLFHSVLHLDSHHKHHKGH